MRRLAFAAAAAVVAATTLAPTTGHAAERWVDRPMTLHRLVFAGDAGLGIGHADLGPFGSATGVGLNLEGAIGITERVELGLRTGIRFGDDARITQADSYGRTNWTETYGVGVDTVANPELRVRWVAYSGSVAEVGLDGRAYLPIEDGTRFGAMFGVPVTFHLSDFVRIDTGAYLPTSFARGGPYIAVAIPGYFWFQISEKLWLGPMASLRINDGGAFRDHAAHLIVGFGLGYQILSNLDFKTQILLPRLGDGLDVFGLGAGVQFRFGE